MRKRKIITTNRKVSIPGAVSEIKKTSDLCNSLLERLSKYNTSMKHFKNFSEDFLSLPWEQKKQTVLHFLQKYGFKNINYENGEMSFEYGEEKIFTCSRHDIDALFLGLESAFVRLEPDLL